MGDTRANFHSVLNMLTAIDWLNICVNDDAMIFAANLRILQGILSRPVIFLISVLSRRSRTLSILTA